MKAKVDKNSCIGCGLCEGICPKIFQMNEDNIAEVIVDEIPTDDIVDANEAKESCPVEAITIEE
ncbi:ferredoxin [Clostridium sp. D2Q-11]|uniref:Ferredoxin n=1 Tax=Anaeromonas frigoriresistens TaxID=2683708 RepID=A0A942V0T8_9FIRM|nr:ferredoxin [Anaeromonas frigoriresistens]MBS4539097.1 ferredoxin [Anaeromonas frigoriresistens]